MSGVLGPRVSVIIPAWNRARTITRAIESVMSQERGPDEVIVIDDGSEDDTAEVVSAFHRSVRYFRQENRGPSSARNHGVRVCSTDWVAFLDSDDTWDTGHLERMMTAICQTKAAAGLYFSDTQRSPDESPMTLWEEAGFKIEGATQLVPDAAEWAMLDYQPMMLQSSVIRKRDYEQVGGLWEELRTREDTHLFLKLSIGRPVCAVSGVGAVMSSADRLTRLTTILGPNTKEYWRCSTLLWQDVIDHCDSLQPRHRRELRERLGTAFLKLARFAATECALRQLVLSSLKAFASNPSAIAAAIGRRLALSSSVQTAPRT